MGKEKTEVKIPFSRMVEEGKVDGWDGATVLKSVVLDPRWEEGKKKGYASQADLVLVKPGKGIAIVECKRKTAGGAKHGAVEQALMYGEMASTIGTEELIRRLQMAKVQDGCGDKDDAVLQRTVEAMEGRREAIQHIVAFERWGSKALPSTVGLTVKLINRALAEVDVPVVQIFAIDEGGFIDV